MKELRIVLKVQAHTLPLQFHIEMLPDDKGVTKKQLLLAPVLIQESLYRLQIKLHLSIQGIGDIPSENGKAQDTCTTRPEGFTIPQSSFGVKNQERHPFLPNVGGNDMVQHLLLMGGCLRIQSNPADLLPTGT